MPSQMWRHNKCCGSTTSMTEPICDGCGAPGTYDGWHYGMFEAMARYQYVTSLKPIGLHRSMTDRVLLKHRVECSDCGGRGLLDADENTYALCVRCEGTGHFWTIPPHRVEAIRRRILAKYPDADAPTAPARWDRRPLVMDVSRGLIIGS